MGFHALMPRMAARRFRRDLALHPDVKLKADDVRAIVLAETEDPDQADEAWRQYRRSELRANITPE